MKRVTNLPLRLLLHLTLQLPWAEIEVAVEAIGVLAEAEVVVAAETQVVVEVETQVVVEVVAETQVVVEVVAETKVQAEVEAGQYLRSILNQS